MCTNTMYSGMTGQWRPHKFTKRNQDFWIIHSCLTIIAPRIWMGNEHTISVKLVEIVYRGIFRWIVIDILGNPGGGKRALGCMSTTLCTRTLMGKYNASDMTGKWTYNGIG